MNYEKKEKIKMLRIYFIFAVLLFFSNSALISANGITIVDKKDAKVELISLKTKEIDFEVSWVGFEIPVKEISNIRFIENEKVHVLTTVSGRKLKGYPYSTDSGELKFHSYLDGTWELGKYSIRISDTKYIDFGRKPQSGKDKSIPNQTGGFFAICTDRAGITTEVSSFINIFHYYYDSQWKGSSGYKTDQRVFFPLEYKGVVMAIPFGSIDMIKFIELSQKRSQRAVIIKLLDGSQLTGKTGILGEQRPLSDSTFNGITGDTEFRGFSLSFDKARQIVFDHKRDRHTSVFYEKFLRTNISHKFRLVDYDSPYNLIVKSWQGNEIVFSNGCYLNFGQGGWWSDIAPELTIKIGESINTITFDKIKKVQFLKKGNSKIRLTTASGKTIEGSLELYVEWLRDTFYKHLGGNIVGSLKRFGFGCIDIRKVASFEIIIKTKK
jgi:hypothetical protein